MTDHPNYDPAARRDTPLALALKERIGRDGPISVAEFVLVCMHDETHGYYRHRAAIGGSGDFITAPEISQVFGELIGLWCAVVWQQMGSPAALQLVELGPGRGTMMRDMLRAMARVPGLLEATRVVLVDVDAALIAAQRDLLAPLAPSIAWEASLLDVAAGPATIVVGNEYLDTCGIFQYVVDGTAVHERTVALGQSGDLEYGRLRESLDIGRLGCTYPSIRTGDIIESQPNVDPTDSLKRFADLAPLAALFIDYGQTGTQTISVGDTLQAVRGHRYEHPLTSPGEADLTAQVNFTEFAQNALDLGLTVDGPLPQGEFLGRLGIVERASRLMTANPAKAAGIETGVARLMAPTGMGSRFKAIAIRSPGLPTLPGF